MKAIVYTKFGPPDVLHLQEVAKPAPKARAFAFSIGAIVGGPDQAADHPVKKPDDENRENEDPEQQRKGERGQCGPHEVAVVERTHGEQRDREGDEADN